MSKKSIAVDMDDVLADAYGRIITLYEEEHDTKPTEKILSEITGLARGKIRSQEEVSIPLSW